MECGDRAEESSKESVQKSIAEIEYLKKSKRELDIQVSSLRKQLGTASFQGSLLLLGCSLVVYQALISFRCVRRARAIAAVGGAEPQRRAGGGSDCRATLAFAGHRSADW